MIAVCRLARCSWVVPARSNFMVLFLVLDDCCEDRTMLLAMFKDIEQDTGIRLHGAAVGDSVDPRGDTLPESVFPSSKHGAYVYGPQAVAVEDRRAADCRGTSWVRNASGVQRRAVRHQTMCQPINSRSLMALQPCLICNACKKSRFPRIFASIYGRS